MKRFGVIGCGSAKQDEPAFAQDMYTSTYFSKNRAYVKEKCDKWGILSAEHGLLGPNSIVRPYDTTLGDDDLDREALINEIAGSTTMRITVEMFTDEVVILAGEDYIDLFRDACQEFDRRIETGEHGWGHKILPNTEIRTPFQENDLGGIGEQMGWVTRQLGEDEEESSESDHEQATLFAATDGGNSRSVDTETAQDGGQR